MQESPIREEMKLANGFIVSSEGQASKKFAADIMFCTILAIERAEGQTKEEIISYFWRMIRTLVGTIKGLEMERDLEEMKKWKNSSI